MVRVRDSVDVLVVPIIGAVKPMERICLVAVGPSIFGIIKSIKITSYNDEENDEGRGRLGEVGVVSLVMIAIASAPAVKLSLIFATATAPSSASSHV